MYSNKWKVWRLSPFSHIAYSEVDGSDTIFMHILDSHLWAGSQFLCFLCVMSISQRRSNKLKWSMASLKATYDGFRWCWWILWWIIWLNYHNTNKNKQRFYCTTHIQYSSPCFLVISLGKEHGAWCKLTHKVYTARSAVEKTRLITPLVTFSDIFCLLVFKLLCFIFEYYILLVWLEHVLFIFCFSDLIQNKHTHTYT